jgi:Zn-dependent M28 family amino/carboxypeptidase
MKKLLPAAVLACVCLAIAQQAPKLVNLSVAGVPSAINDINPEHIRAEVKLLASDYFEGRGTGQRGGELAAEYIATQFELAGLKPAGDNGTFLQKVPMAGVTTQSETSLKIVPGSGAPMPLRFGEDFVTSNQTLAPASDIDADIVYVGYGIEAPEYKWDDYKGADLKGKVLLMLVNEPPSDDPNFFKGKALTYYGRWTYKYEEAARRGAVGVLIVHKTEMASYGWNVVRNSWGGEISYLRDDSAPKLQEAGWVQLDVARKVAQAGGQNLDELMAKANSRDFRPIPLPLKMQAHIVSKVRKFDSANVIGEVPGTDPALKNEAILYSGHWDHFGIGPMVNGQNIYHGAADNATGTAMLLESARAWAASAQKPKRSILFAAVTGEEQGLLGSRYLGEHPPIPAARISLDLNYDNVTPYGVPEDVEVSGAERTNFYPVVEQTAREFHLAIRPDDKPEAGHYYRSDHFSLARVGVPAFSVQEGVKFAGHDAKWGEDQKAEYTAKRYHQPADEYKADMDFRGDAMIAKFGFALGWRAANQAAEVGWKPGDEFEAARKRSMQASVGQK